MMKCSTYCCWLLFFASFLRFGFVGFFVFVIFVLCFFLEFSFCFFLSLFLHIFSLLYSEVIIFFCWYVRNVTVNICWRLVWARPPLPGPLIIPVIVWMG